MMTLHYHGTPVTPITALYELAGRHFCVSHAHPQDVARVHQIGQSVLLDNGAFSAWTAGRTPDWVAYYEWCARWLEYPTTWAIVPDVIDGSEEEQDALIVKWPHGQRGAPVWHMNESLGRLLRLVDAWPRVCIGSTAQFRVVLSDSWRRRMDEVWDLLAVYCFGTPWVHMLRGLQCCAGPWPFASVDSTDIARNHSRPQNTPRGMADRWDAMQCPPTWRSRDRQLELVA
jgi:hypothetical protein